MTELDLVYDKAFAAWEANPEEIEREEPLLAKAFREVGRNEALARVRAELDQEREAKRKAEAEIEQLRGLPLMAETRHEQPAIERVLEREKITNNLQGILAETQEQLRKEREAHRQAREHLAGAREELNATKQKLDDEDKVRKRLNQMQEEFSGILEAQAKRLLAPNLIEPNYGSGEKKELAGKGWKKGVA